MTKTEKTWLNAPNTMADRVNKKAGIIIWGSHSHAKLITPWEHRVQQKRCRNCGKDIIIYGNFS